MPESVIIKRHHETQMYRILLRTVAKLVDICYFFYIYPKWGREEVRKKTTDRYTHTYIYIYTIGI